MCCDQVPRSAYADLVKIGQEKTPWYCDEYNDYLAFEFDNIEPMARFSEPMARFSALVIRTGQKCD
jgi:hypothetical protein